ncbi:MAG: diguanylate cyclase [Pseudomonadota bacterium]|jgi:diguanylate cyclase (GGDEF)-like protein
MGEDTSGALPRVLIVDDSRIVRATLVKRIKDKFDILEEGDGEAAWQTLLADGDIQVVISDLTMPRLDGYGLLKRMRFSEIGRIRSMPVIMISGDEDEAARQRAKECGANDFITKGTSTVELVARLESLIQLARTSRELERSRAVIAESAAVDVASGLYTRCYLERQGEQALSHARRHHGEVSALVIGLDRFDELIAEHGEVLGTKLVARFAKMLRGSVRKEDSVAQVGPCEFAIVSPMIGFGASTSFALRLKDGISRAAIHYGGKAVQLTISVGVSNSSADRIDSSEALLQKAEERMNGARGAGGNQVIGHGQVLARAVPPTLDRAVGLLRAGNGQAVRPHLAALAASLLPLLRLIDAEYGLRADLAALEERVAKETG